MTLHIKIQSKYTLGKAIVQIKLCDVELQMKSRFLGWNIYLKILAIYNCRPTLTPDICIPVPIYLMLTKI